VFPVGSIASSAASAFGLMAAAIAVCGFLLQAPAALVGKEDRAVRAAVVGGLFGFLIATGFVLVELW
jgi:uncharacterized membrane protein